MYKSTPTSFTLKDPFLWEIWGVKNTHSKNVLLWAWLSDDINRETAVHVATSCKLYVLHVSESETDSSQSDEPGYENTLGSTSENDSEAPEPGEIAPYSYEPSSSDSGSDSSVSEQKIPAVSLIYEHFTSPGKTLRISKQNSVRRNALERYVELQINFSQKSPRQS